MTSIFAPEPLQFTAWHGFKCKLLNEASPATRLGAAGVQERQVVCDCPCYLCFTRLHCRIVTFTRPDLNYVMSHFNTTSWYLAVNVIYSVARARCLTWIPCGDIAKRWGSAWERGCSKNDQDKGEAEVRTWCSCQGELRHFWCILRQDL